VHGSESVVLIGADQSVREVGAGSLLAVGLCTAVLFVVSSVSMPMDRRVTHVMRYR